MRRGEYARIACLRSATRVVFGSLALLIVLIIAFALLQRSVLSRSGLRGVYRAGADWTAAPRFEVDHDAISKASVRRRTIGIAGPVSVEWQGFLIVPESARYRFAADAIGALDVQVDRRTVLHVDSGSALTAIDLRRGQHDIDVRYANHAASPRLNLSWARDNAPLSTIPQALLVPAVVTFRDVRLRRMLAWLDPVLPFLGGLALVAALGLGVTILVRTAAPQVSALPATGTAILALAACLYGAGIWWNLFSLESWAPDELRPDAIRTAVEFGFRRGWSSIYPAFHFGLLAIVTGPFHVLAAAGAIDLDDLRVDSAMLLVSRAASTVMAIGLVATVMGLARRISERAAILAGLAVLAILPMAYYAKTANVDVPCAFWIVLSMAFYLRARETAATRDLLGFVLCGAASISTKDQAYGFYVLPALFLVISSLRSSRLPVTSGVPSIAQLVVMTTVFLIAIAVGDDVLLNWKGFVDHVNIITGQGSTPFRIFPNTAAGQLQMAGAALAQMAQAMSWPLFLGAAAAACAAWRRRVTLVSRLLLPIASYYLSVIAVIGYHYDRFFLAPLALLAVAFGWGADAWLTSGRLHALARLSIGVTLLYGLLRVAGLDAIMIRDSRYVVEGWLLEHAPPGAIIAASPEYPPRRAKVFWIGMPEDLDALAAVHPDFIVVNTVFTSRQEPGSPRAAFLDALSSGRTPYRRVLQFRTQVPWSPLGLEARFTAARDDPFSNLAKINPLVEVYAR
jgi:hypothetical protein